jgi:hypothetical protein
MSAVGWTSLMRLFQGLATRYRSPRPSGPKRRKMTLGLESLEPISLLSSVGAPISTAAAVRLHDLRVQWLANRHHSRGASASASGTAATPTSTSTAASPVTVPAQALSLPSTLTNFTNQPLSPSLSLFNPSLGTLTSVTVTESALLQSMITSQNRSTTSSTVITASLSGSYEIDGLSQPIVQPTRTFTSAPETAGPLGSGTDTVTFPPLQLSSSSATIFSDPASLAFFTASPGRTTITPTMTATASGSAHAGANLSTTAVTTASSNLAVSYTYIPTTPTPTPSPTSCPGTGPISRTGVHHQKTLLTLPFIGPVDPVLAGTPGDYVVISRTGHKIPIISANYNASTNSVTLRPAHSLNVHDRFVLKVTLPCTNGMTNMVVRLPFGTKYSLVGFHNKRGQFVSVHDGRIVRSDS